MDKKQGVIVAMILVIIVALTGVLSSYATVFTPAIILAIIAAGAVILVMLEKPIWAVLAATFFLPFERIGSFELAGTTVRPSQLIALVVIAGWLAQSLAKKEKVARNPLIIPIALFIAASSLSLLNAINLERAITVLLFELFVVVIALVLPNIITRAEASQKVTKVLIATTVMVSIFGVYQFIGDMIGLPSSVTGLRPQYTSAVFGFPRVQSTALEPLYFGNFLLIPISILIALFLTAKEKFKNKFFFMLIPLMLAGVNLVLTLSRGAYLGLAVVGLLTAIVFFKELVKPSRIISLASIALVIVVSIPIFFNLAGPKADKALQTFQGQATNISTGAGVVERFKTYDEAIMLFERNPIVGVGVGNFGPNLAQNPHRTPDKGWLIVNNVYLEILAERGIVGLITFAAIIVALYIRTIKALIVNKHKTQSRIILIALSIALAGILAQYATFSILYILHVWFIIGLIIALQNMLLANKKEPQK